MKVESESEVAQSCPTLSDPMDCSLPGSSIHGIFQATELTKTEQGKKKKKILKREDSLKDQWDSIKYNKIYITGVSEGEEQEKKGQKAYSKKQ